MWLCKSVRLQLRSTGTYRRQDWEGRTQVHALTDSGDFGTFLRHATDFLLTRPGTGLHFSWNSTPKYT